MMMMMMMNCIFIINEYQLNKCNRQRYLCPNFLNKIIPPRNFLNRENGQLDFKKESNKNIK